MRNGLYHTGWLIIILSWYLPSFDLFSDTSEVAGAAVLLPQDEIAGYVRLWGNRVDTLISLLQTLLSKIESGFYVPLSPKDRVTLWIREAIKELYHRYKRAMISITQDRLACLIVATYTYIEMLQQALNSNCAILSDFSPDTIVFPSEACMQESMLRTLNAMDVQLERLQKAIDMSGLTFINRVARRIEDVTDWIHTKTYIYSWYNLLPYVPAALIFVRCMLPESVQKIIEQRIYGVKNGVSMMPQWSVDYAVKGVPDIRILNSDALHGYLGRAERLYASIIKIYFLVQLAKQFLDAKTLEIITYIPHHIAQSLEEKWQHIKGIPFKSPVRYEIIDHIDLDDERLIGLDDQRSQLKSVVDYILDPENYLSEGKAIEKGILLTGPSRTGKTLIAQALAGSINKELRLRGRQDEMAFIEVKFDEIKQWKSQDAFERLINEARLHAPCILFLDELHTYGLQTTGDSSLYNAMLTIMNKLYNSNDPKDQVFIIGATNRPDLIACELRSPKRFGKEIRFGLPNFGARQQFFNHKLLNELVLDADSLDINSYARQTVGCSYGQLQAIIDVAKFMSKHNAVTHVAMQMALDNEVHHLLIYASVAPEETKVLAAHQAGHALLAYLLKPLASLELVTIRGFHKSITEILESQTDKSNYHPNEQFNIEYGKILRYNPYEAIGLIDAAESEKNILIQLGGYLAEEILLGRHILSYHRVDKPEAFEQIKQILFDGLDCCAKDATKLSIGAHKDKSRDLLCREIEAKAREQLIELEKRARSLLVAHSHDLALLAEALEKHSTLTARDIEVIVYREEQT